MMSGEDLGAGSWIKREYRTPDDRLIAYPAGGVPPEGSVFVGLMENHRNGDQWCGGWVGFTNVAGSHEHSVHELVSADPLTVAPSLLCRRCGRHGFIRDGQWCPA